MLKSVFARFLLFMQERMHGQAQRRIWRCSFLFQWGLVDVREDPIERITPKGIKTRDAEYELDVIIYATGFDAVSGAFTRMDIRGEGGQTFKDRWAGGVCAAIKRFFCKWSIQLFPKMKIYIAFFPSSAKPRRYTSVYTRLLLMARFSLRLVPLRGSSL